MATRRGAGLAMPDEALLDDPQLVRIAPVPAPHAIRRGKNFNLGSERKVGHKAGRITAAENLSGGPRRRHTDVLSKWALVRGQIEPRVWAEIDILLDEIAVHAAAQNAEKDTPET